jgi:hypothetical protein
MKQAQFCDGLRFTAEMADLAYTQLSSCLFNDYAPNRTGTQNATTPFLFAWSVVDSAFRLYGLVKNFPGFAGKNKIPEFRAFERHMKPIEELRHSVQHMHDDIRQYGPEWRPVWGDLNWIRLSDTEPGKGGHMCVLVSGSMQSDRRYDVTNPLGLVCKFPIDHITLTLGNVKANLSATMEVLSRLVVYFEDKLRDSFKNLPSRSASDLFVSLEFGHEPPASQPES